MRTDPTRFATTAGRVAGGFGVGGAFGGRWAARGVAAAAILAMSGAVVVSGTATTTGTDSNADLPATLTLTGVVRDFKARGTAGGHADFEYQPTAGYGQYVNMVADLLDAEGKPVYRSTGNQMTKQYMDVSNRPKIGPKPYITAREGDKAGSVSAAAGGAIAGAAAGFAQWYRDVPGVNASEPLAITLVRQAGTNIYTFNDQTDAAFARRGGFFPIDGELFGNMAGTSHNFGFSFELSTNFVYRRGGGQVFTFTGDDDVFVFVDGKLVIDIGGVHGAMSQTIELDRLNWLEDGHTYPLKFFFTERHTTASNCRIETTINLRNADLPATTALYD